MLIGTGSPSFRLEVSNRRPVARLVLSRKTNTDGITKIEQNAEDIVAPLYHTFEFDLGIHA